MHLRAVQPSCCFQGVLAEALHVLLCHCSEKHLGSEAKQKATTRSADTQRNRLPPSKVSSAMKESLIKLVFLPLFWCAMPRRRNAVTMMSIRSLVDTLLNGFDCISSGSVSSSSDADSKSAILYMTSSTSLAYAHALTSSPAPACALQTTQGMSIMIVTMHMSKARTTKLSNKTGNNISSRHACALRKQPFILCPLALLDI